MHGKYILYRLFSKYSETMPMAISYLRMAVQFTCKLIINKLNIFGKQVFAVLFLDGIEKEPTGDYLISLDNII